MLYTATVVAALATLGVAVPQNGLPRPVTGYTKIRTPNGATIRYKEPGKAGICETTPGVNSYSGYIDLGAHMHSWFWFFESRRDPASDPITLWLNGGPGSDSQIGLFQEHGPCNITAGLKSKLNPYSWNEESNMIYLSQPFGTGFSYQTKGVGSLDPLTAEFISQAQAPPDGRYPLHNPLGIDTSELAAITAYEVIQGLYSGLPKLAPTVKSKVFNLWTESYGGHYGPAFYDYFYKQNEKVKSGQIAGIAVEMNSLGLINAIINEKIQAPYYPEFAIHNTYGIKAYNETVYNYAKMAAFMPGGCRDQYDFCAAVNRTTLAGRAICDEATAMCRDNVEGPYYYYGNRGVYDIRHPYNDPTPPPYFEDYLNLPKIQQAIGTDLNYTTSNTNTYYAFQQSGDFLYPDFLKDLSRILNLGVAVGLFYGDADYICNWFGGEAVSKEVKYQYAKQFRAAGYQPFTVNGVRFGDTRQYGNFSFTRIYEAGHEVPYYQPEASLAYFNRLNDHLQIADGKKVVTPDYTTHGDADTTHTEPFVPLPAKTGSATSGGGDVFYKIIKGRKWFFDTHTGDLKV